jgi:anti-sigma factor RsiW
MPPDQSHEPADERELAEVAAFADGSLPAARRPEVEARIAGSAALTEELERQRMVLRAIRNAAAPAPDSLRAAVAARRGASRPARRPALIAAGVAAAAVAGLAALLLLPSGAPEGPSVATAAGLAKRGPDAPPPPRYDDEPALLAAKLEGVRFPRWQQRFGWHATGARRDRLDGRRVATVFYRARDRQLAYTIVGGAPLQEHGGRRFVQADTRFRLIRRGSARVLTWRRKGHTCVVTAAGVRTAELLALASWRAGGRVEY